MTGAIEKGKRARGTGSMFMRGNTLYIRYYKHGRRIVESTHTNDPVKAERKLQRALRLIETGEYLSPKQRKIRARELWEGLIKYYKLQEKATTGILESKWELRLGPFFADIQARAVTTDLLSDYIEKCRKDGLQTATINRDLSALHKAFTLGFKCTPKKVQQIPVFPDRLPEATPRKGFVEQPQFDALCSATKELWMRALITTAYTFGFRRGELLNMRVNQVDLVNRTIRLYRGETKSGEPRLVKMTEDVFVLLSAMCQGKNSESRVFTRNGEPIVDIRDEWTRMTKAAKLPDLIFHDLRRSAVRNMIRAGISERVAMSISGHKTRSVFDRYDIVSEADLSRAAEQIAVAQTAERSKSESEFGIQNGIQLRRYVA
jgi:integrase